MVAPNPYAPFKAREDGPLAVLPMENPRLQRPRTCPWEEGTYTFSAAPGTEGNYLDEVWTIDDRSGGISVADLNDGAGNDRHFYHCNTLYSVYGLTDEAANLVEAYQYDAYGRQTVISDGNDGDTIVNFSGNDVRTVGGNSLIGNPYMYTGQRFDPETGLYYCKNRFLNVDLGRWMSRDPIRYGDGLGLYESMISNPIKYVDELGLRTWFDIGDGWRVGRDVIPAKGVNPPTVEYHVYKDGVEQALVTGQGGYRRTHAGMTLKKASDIPKPVRQGVRCLVKDGARLFSKLAFAVVLELAMAENAHAAESGGFKRHKLDENCYFDIYESGYYREERRTDIVEYNFIDKQWQRRYMVVEFYQFEGKLRCYCCDGTWDEEDYTLQKTEKEFIGPSRWAPPPKDVADRFQEALRRAGEGGE